MLPTDAIVDCHCIFTSQEMVSFSDIAPTFDQGAHHPTVLVVLQAMAALIGEVHEHHLCPRAGGQRVSQAPPQLLGRILGMRLRGLPKQHHS